MNDLGQKIKELRMDKGLTMEEFGELCNTEKTNGQQLGKRTK